MNSISTFRLSALMRAGLLIAILAWSVWIVPNQARAQGPNPPERLAYQGYLTDGGGNPLGSPNPQNYDIIFRIWDGESGGTRLWSEQQTITVDDGFFSAMLGEGGPPAGETGGPLSAVFSGSGASVRWVGITVKGIGAGGADLDILPRLRLLTSPYAFLATRAMSMDVAGLTGTLPVTQVPATVARRDQANNLTGAQNISGNLVVSGTQTFNSAQQLNSTLNVTGAATFNSSVTASSFVGRGVVPVRGIIMYSGSEADLPPGWALCDGRPGTPNLTDRFILGGSFAESTAGVTGGEATVTLNVNQIPSHSHVADPPPTNTSNNGRHRHGITVKYGGGISGGGTEDGSIRNNDSNTTFNHDTEFDGEHTHSVNIAPFNTSSIGGSQAHNNMPPYYTLAFIIRLQ